MATLPLFTKFLMSGGLRRKPFGLTDGVESSKSFTSNADISTILASGLIALMFAANSDPFFQGICTSDIRRVRFLPFILKCTCVRVGSVNP